jgi:CelD/BcsL family acetyltransferase involved in cellulose biosynthesis
MGESRLRLVLLKEIPEDAELRRQWNALVLREEQPQVFYTYEWALAVHRAYNATLRPLLFLAYDGQDSLCAVAALATDPEGKRVSFLGATTGDYCDFLGGAEYREEFLKAILDELKKLGVAEMAFANLPADSITAAMIGRVGALGHHTFSRTGYICAQVSLGSLERRGDAKPVLPRKKMLRRFLNAMGREAPVRLEHARSREEIEAVLPEFMQAHVARFLVNGRISNTARPERQIFLRELTQLLSGPGWVVLTRMMSARKVFAWHYGFQFQGTWFWYQPTFVNDLEKYSPGFCLLAKVIEEAADNPGLRVLDLGLGAEEYKDRFANQTRRTLYVTLTSSRARHYREVLRFRAAEIVRSSPRAEETVRAATERWQRLRKRMGRDGSVSALAWARTRLRGLLWLKCEVVFYEWRGSTTASASPVGSQDLGLQVLDLKMLASAVTQYVDDDETLTYLLRATTRLQAGKAEGFALVDPAGNFLHFAWATAFDGFFLAELRDQVEAPSADCVLLFDCWTPSAATGHGYYAQTVELVADLVRKRGQRPWIFSAAGNVASVRGLEKTGFQRRYSLARQRLLGWQWIKGQTPKSQLAAQDRVAAAPEDSAA